MLWQDPHHCKQPAFCCCPAARAALESAAVAVSDPVPPQFFSQSVLADVAALPRIPSYCFDTNLLS